MSQAELSHTGTGAGAGVDWRAVIRSAADNALKRSIDIVLGLILSALTLVLIGVLCAGAALSFRARPFFAQTRVGRNRESFRLVKIRSLPEATAAYADKYFIQNQPNTRFGRRIRSLHLDELPQLWLVVVGKMSLVGPRPEMPHLDAQFSEEQRRARANFRPGCTGLWQVSCDSNKLMLECPQYDVFYARHHSTRFDLWILYRTIALHVAHRHVELDQVPSWLLADKVRRTATTTELADIGAGDVRPAVSTTITNPSVA